MSPLQVVLSCGAMAVIAAIGFALWGVRALMRHAQGSTERRVREASEAHIPQGTED